MAKMIHHAKSCRLLNAKLVVCTILVIYLQRNTALAFQSPYQHKTRPSLVQRNINILSPQRQQPLQLSLGSNAILSSYAWEALPIQPLASQFLVRIVFLRAMAFVSLVAFTIARQQNKALIGDNGITPARHVSDEAQQRGAEKLERRIEWRKEMKEIRDKQLERQGSQGASTNNISIIKLTKQHISRIFDSNQILTRIRQILVDRTDTLGRPLITLLWLVKYRQKNMNLWLDSIANTGIAVSLLVMVCGAANIPLILTLWLCQRSLMSVGGPWYGFGWEPQLAEVFFHTLFIVPTWSLEQIPKTAPISPLVSFTFSWLLFRVMIGAGLIKFRSGDKKWKDLTAMNYFYQTQPVPNPLTRMFHYTPQWWHKFEVLSNHFVELIAPWLLIIPYTLLPSNMAFVKLRRAGGIVQMVFQSILITSGNLSFLNWLTILPAIFSLDDTLLARFFPLHMQQSAALAAMTVRPGRIRQIISILSFALIAKLSIPVVKNLCSKKQIMNSSFDRYRLVNTYGAFGTVDEERYELVISSTPNFDIEPVEYEFKVKPGSIYKRPQFLSPFHYRLDWQMWIAATTRRMEQNTWLYSLMIKLLQRDEEVIKLIKTDPWKDSDEPPKYIKVDLYKYRFHDKSLSEQSDDGGSSDKECEPFWDREFVKRFYPRQGIATLASLEDELRSLYPNRYSEGNNS